MNWLDYLPAALAAVACLATMLVCFARARRAEQRYARLRDDVAAFSEASVRVADTLDALLQGQVKPEAAHLPSRRYVLAEAQRGIAQGESLEQVAGRLHLSHDESRLLAFAAMGQGRQQAKARCSSAKARFSSAETRSTRIWAA